MTNIFHPKALSKLEKDFPKEISRIRTAARNYELRDLLLSVYFYRNDQSKNFLTGVESAFIEDGIKQSKIIRGIKYGDEKYPFKQTAPKKLINLFLELIERGSAGYYDWCLDFNFPMDELVYELESYYKLEEAIFFCSEQYTKETGIQPYVGGINKVVNEQIKYLLWKFNKKDLEKDLEKDK
jgi:hypothetical protein